MKNIVQMLLLITALISGLIANAQDAEPKKEVEKKSSGILKGWAISANVGTLGAGGTINKRLTNHFSFCAGYFTSNLQERVATTFDRDKVDLGANIKVGAYTFLLEIYPSKNKSFRFVTGCAYNRNAYNIDITPSGTQKYGFIEYTPNQVGSISLDITGANWAPYLGIGFGRAIPKRLLGIGLDMGAFYHGDPTVKLHCTGTFTPSNTEENKAVLQKAFKGYAFYPFINLRLTCRIIR